MSFCPVEIDTYRYYQKLDREWAEEQAMREEAISQRAETRAALLGNRYFLSEMIGEESGDDEILAAFASGSDELLGAAVRKLVEGRLDELLDDVVEGISHEGSMKKLREWWP